MVRGDWNLLSGRSDSAGTRHAPRVAWSFRFLWLRRPFLFKAPNEPVRLCFLIAGGWNYSASGSVSFFGDYLIRMDGER